MAPFVVKVQLSLASTASKRQVLIYNEDRTVYQQGIAGEDILETMGVRSKAFFLATHEDNGSIVIGSEVPDPHWEK